MKLGELKAKIRATKGAPSIRVELVPGTPLVLSLMKTPLLASLDEGYPGGKATETGLVLDVNGDDALLRAEAFAAAGTVQAVAAEPIAAFEVVAVRPQVASATSLLLDLDEPAQTLEHVNRDGSVTEVAVPARSSTLLDF